MNISKKNELNFLKAFIFFSGFIVGGYYTAISCFFSVILAGFIIYKSFTTKEKEPFKFNITVGATTLLVVSYLVVSIWAVDSGTAVYGFFKLLPVALLGFIVSGYDKTERNQLLEAIPLSAAVNGVLAYGLSFIPFLSNYLLVAERLGGFFQSPNAFAVFCLAGIVILLTAEKVDLKSWIINAVLVVVIFLTGSRTVFIFLVLTVIAFFFTLKNKKLKRNILLIFGGMVLISIAAVFITDSVQTVGRFLTISLESSTFLGRILYYLDALPVILKHPFGLGYYGYYFSQGSFQTGVYSIAFVHNSALQFLLDVGWVPSLAFFFVIGASFFSKKSDLRQRLLLFTVFGHSLFDFDLEFVCVFFVIILALNYDLYKQISFKPNAILVSAIAGVLILTSVYFGFVNSMYLLGKYEAVEKIYGHDTMTKMQLLTTEANDDRLLEYAEEIIEENGYLAIAYDVKANHFYEKGDFKKVIKYKNKAIDCAPYSIEEYTDFCEKLLIGVSLYENVNDKQSARVCKRELVDIIDRLAETKEKTSPLAWKIQNKPELDLPEEYAEIIEEYENSGEF